MYRPNRERGGHHSGRGQSNRGHDRRQVNRNAGQTTNKPRRLEQTPAEPQVVELITNAYGVKNADSSFKIYEYELIVVPSRSCQDLPSKVLGRTFVSRSIRKLIMNKFVPNLTDSAIPRGSIVIEPNLSAIYTTNIFTSCEKSTSLIDSHGKASPQKQEFKFDNETVATDLITDLRVDVLIKFTRVFTSNPGGYNGSLLASIIHHQLMIDMLRYGSVYYLERISNMAYSRQPTRLDLLSQHLTGISISGAKRSTDDQSLVVINCSHSYITQSHRIIDLLACFVADRPVEHVQLLHSMRESSHRLRRVLKPELSRIRVDEESFASFCTILSGFKCQASVPGLPQVNLRFCLSEQAAEDLYLDNQTNVFKQFQGLGININYPNLPCLKSRSQMFPFYPMELCTLLSGQKVPIFRLSAAARNHLTDLNKPKPALTKYSSARARDDIVELNKEQFKSFGIELSESPVEATGHTLSKPTLKYRDRMLEPTMEFWESGVFYQAVDLIGNWCYVDTVGLDAQLVMDFFRNFSDFSKRFGFNIGPPNRLELPKSVILEQGNSMETIIANCMKVTRNKLRLILFIIDSSSTALNRMIHLAFDEHPSVTATCLRAESILKERQHRSIYRTLVHKLNARLGGTNVAYHERTFEKLNLDCNDLMVVGLDVTHPDNELNGVSIVGCAYTFTKDLFRHKSLVWPQAARVEIIGRMDSLMQRLISEYMEQNQNRLPKHIIVYRDGVSHEEFERVRTYEISKASSVIDQFTLSTNQPKPNLSYIIAQKRHTMRFFKVLQENLIHNPPAGTLISHGVVAQNDYEFYLYSNTSPQATARPLHYHILVNGMGLENLHKLTYYLCFNFGKCSSSLSMPSSLRYAHNAAYDARNRVIAAKEFHENRFYTTKFFC